MTTFVRRSIWGLESQQVWDPYTTAYAQAVAVMRSRPSTDPTSWAFQAAIHGAYADPPPNARWNECQHGTWFFLPWHRMYLYWFERIVRAIVVAGDGPDDWALPFWNYSVGSPDNQLPPAFRAPTWDPGTGEAPNPLFTSQRSASYNAGAGLPASVVNLNALGSANYTGRPQPGFGGPVTGFSHQPQAFGELENVPHNQVHVQVGGQGRRDCAGGWMVDPNCAAQDPIFWLHHANIDRLWSEWIALGDGRANPTDPRWLTRQTFTLYDEQGQEVTMCAGDVLDTVTQLGYDYEAQPPTPGLMPGRARAEVTMTQPSAPGPPPAAPKLAAATEGGVTLGTARTDARVDLPPTAQHALRAAVDPGDASVRHVYLNVEGLEADETPGVSWEVHLNLPAGAPAGAGDHLAGLISFFGFRRPLEAAADEHGLGPMVHTFDITDLVKGLKDEGRWDDVAATVSFVPVGPGVEEMTATPRVGRVSISYQ